jgi:hypothetical protein
MQDIIGLVYAMQVRVSELGPLSLAGLSGLRPLLVLKGVTLGPGPVEKSSGQVMEDPGGGGEHWGRRGSWSVGLSCVS